MGKPLSRPDCLRQNPTCVGKAEEEDLNIEDCYVPQRSIYDTVRLNEQIDSGSKGSLTSRHFTDRTLPYSNRTLDSSTLCSNGALACNSEVRNRDLEPSKLDEKMIFDALKFNREISRPSGGPRNKHKTDKREHRRSWRIFVPVNLADYVSRNEGSYVESPASDTLNTCRKETNSLTSEDDSGLCSPQADGDEKTEQTVMDHEGQDVSLPCKESSNRVGKLFSEISNCAQHSPFLLYAKVQNDLDFSLIACSITDSKSPEFHSALNSDMDMDSECSIPCEEYIHLEDSLDLFEEDDQSYINDHVRRKSPAEYSSNGLDVYNGVNSATSSSSNFDVDLPRPDCKHIKMARAKSLGVLGSPACHKCTVVRPTTIPMRDSKCWTKELTKGQESTECLCSKVIYHFVYLMALQNRCLCCFSPSCCK